MYRSHTSSPSSSPLGQIHAFPHSRCFCLAELTIAIRNKLSWSNHQHPARLIKSGDWRQTNRHSSKNRLYPILLHKGGYGLRRGVGGPHTVLFVGGTFVPGPSLASALQAHLWPILYGWLADEVRFILPAPSLLLPDRLNRLSCLTSQLSTLLAWSFCTHLKAPGTMNQPHTHVSGNLLGGLHIACIILKT